ncbi:predicted protein [Histoplasma capsulatum var. duboisii H88]|uniref:Predicted protein n=1 Tax=Ajellomyces capsulatus (strain H88) TaxID=544711 RepID=F0U4Z5_AJEC8|nr:predicted protein [Histoplasma capsulatum var. duboisii H88]
MATVGTYSTHDTPAGEKNLHAESDKPVTPGNATAAKPRKAPSRAVEWPPGQPVPNKKLDLEDDKSLFTSAPTPGIESALDAATSNWIVTSLISGGPWREVLIRLETTSPGKWLARAARIPRSRM